MSVDDSKNLSVNSQKEGELKKRLNGQWLSGNITLPIMNKILDEVKNSFPATPKNCLEDMDYPERVRYWFRCWFGEPK